MFSFLSPTNSKDISTATAANTTTSQNDSSIDTSSLFSKIANTKDRMTKALSESFEKIDGKTISHAVLITGKIIEMIPVFDKIGTAMAGLAKLNIDRVAYNRIKETVIDPIEKLKNTLIFLKKLNEITKEMSDEAIKTITEKLNESANEVVEDEKEIEEDINELNDDKEMAEGTDGKLAEVIKDKIEDDKKEIEEKKEELKEHTNKIVTEIETNQKDLIDLLKSVQQIQVSETTIANITKKLEEIVDTIIPKSGTKDFVYSWRDKIDEIDIIMKTMENEMQSLMLQYSTFIFFVGIGFAKMDPSLPSKFLQKIINTEEFKLFSTFSTTGATKISGMGGVDAANAANALAQLRGGRSKRRKSRGKKRTTRRHRRKLREPSKGTKVPL